MDKTLFKHLWQWTAPSQSGVSGQFAVFRVVEVCRPETENAQIPLLKMGELLVKGMLRKRKIAPQTIVPQEVGKRFIPS